MTLSAPIFFARRPCLPAPAGEETKMSADAIRCLPLALGPGLSGGFFDRQGGVSPPPYDSLNVGLGVGDEPGRVAENRRRLKAALGLTVLVSARQVHGDRILCLSSPVATDAEHDGYDALITDQPGLGLMIQQADCQAVVIFEPVRRVVANVHVGWRGSVAGIIAAVVRRLREEFGAEAARMRATISPSLGPCCAEFIHYQYTLPAVFHPYQSRPAHFDFWAISRMQLEQAGVPASEVKVAGICTRCGADFFSYRRQAVTGRAATVAFLP